jgi:hypothetical protein
MLNIRYGEAVDVALAHSLDMPHLCRADSTGARAQVPAL